MGCFAPGRRFVTLSPFHSPRALSAKLRMLLCGVVRSNVSLKRRKVNQSGYVIDCARAVNYFSSIFKWQIASQFLNTKRLISTNILIRTYVHCNQTIIRFDGPKQGNQIFEVEGVFQVLHTLLIRK